MQKKNQKSNQISKSEFSKVIREFLKEELTTKEEALRFMQEVGAIGKNGKLTKNYGG